MAKTTESDSLYDGLHHMSTSDLVTAMNELDQTVAVSVQKQLPAITALIDAVYNKMQSGGRLFYIGSGTSGRLGVVDASECPPTFGVAQGRVVGIIAGENAEDDVNQAWLDLKHHDVTFKDFVVGISASGTTPYVLGGLKKCVEHKVLCGSITCNDNSAVGIIADYPVDCPVGPEFVTGSTRMKSGTAQKLILNMITTSVMIKLGHVQGNKMIDMQLSNDKLVDRGTKMIMAQTNLNYEQANAVLREFGSVRKALDSHLK
jgi:N-acetylmuramic acid 6-phosphate etherase